MLFWAVRVGEKITVWSFDLENACKASLSVRPSSRVRQTFFYTPMDTRKSVCADRAAL